MTKRKCKRCSTEFDDYSKNFSHTLCLSCWKIKQNQHIYRLPKSEHQSVTEKCLECRGHGRIEEGGEFDNCQHCQGTGIRESEDGEGLVLGR